MSRYLCSIIVPVYNRPEGAREIFERFTAANRYGRYQLIMVDDRSTRIYTPPQTPHLVSISMLDNTGGTGVRNQGLEVAEGDFCIFLDSDDLIDFNALNAILDRVSAVEYADLPLFVCGRLTEASDLRLRATTAAQMFSFNAIGPISACIFRRSVLAAHTVSFTEALRSCQDWSYYVKLLDIVPRYAVLGAAFSEYRLSDDSISNNKPKLLAGRLGFYRENRHRPLINRLDFWASTLSFGLRRCEARLTLRMLWGGMLQDPRTLCLFAFYAPFGVLRFFVRKARSTE